MIFGELAKLKIIAFKDSSFNDAKRVGERFFLAQVNPETYSVEYSASYRVNEQPSGPVSYDPPWERNELRSMRFEFLFDGTGAIPNFESKISEQLPNVPIVENLVDEVTSRVSVLSQIAFFENTVFNVQGDTHVPNYLIINWGSLVFKCRLKGMSITYKLFSPEGFPLRATANATFIEVHSEVDTIKKISPGSPDITHVRQVQEGDTLPLMAKRVYGDERYYLAVAQANRLVQFRNLTPGQEIYFPPIRRG